MAIPTQLRTCERNHSHAYPTHRDLPWLWSRKRLFHVLSVDTGEDDSEGINRGAKEINVCLRRRLFGRPQGTRRASSSRSLEFSSSGDRKPTEYAIALYPRHIVAISSSGLEDAGLPQHA
ncbi:hypothetical protein CMUS01_12466 [Colletotrichum musicola]|uniref:Uncharacterized protein n=1 Tax=Colletotrichum musicola TaxID=2175873 RepID=A0A8H6JL85_9PEZI|nr:hypothetical protein CMUS01_12466 [Colletotrichum musicola]